MNHHGMIRRFLYIWIIYWLVYFVQPVTSIYPDILQALALQVSFVFCTYVFFIIGSSSAGSINIVEKHSFDTSNALFLVRGGILLSILGIIFLLYDKIFIQQIDYSQGLAAARHEWRVLGEERSSAASSLYSAIGYLLGGAYFVSLALLLSRYFILNDRERAVYLLICAFLVFLNSAITGGRSSILLAIIFGCFGYFTKNNSQQETHLFKNESFMKYFKFLLFLGSVYSVYIFYERALAGEQVIGAYGITFLEYLGLAPYDWFAHVAYETDWGAIASLLNLAISYLTHSLATTAAIVGSSNDYGDAMFVNFMQIGAKFGILPQPSDWFMGGRFSSLPGALYFQYGAAGLLIGSAILGTVTGRLAGIFSSDPTRMLVFFLCSISELILLMSPFLFAAEFLFFPSILVGGLLIIFLSKLRPLQNAAAAQALSTVI